MSIILKNVECEMKKDAGEHNFGEAGYCPEVMINYVASEKEPVRIKLLELCGRFDESDYQGIVICADFFVLVFKSEWEIISSEGILLKSMSPCGQIVDVQEHYFIVRNGDTITGYGQDGKSIGSRKLTAREMKILDGERVLKSVTCKMKKAFGMFVSGSDKHTIMYSPKVTIVYENPEMESIQVEIFELCGRFKPSAYQDVVVCDDFFVLSFKTEWEIVSSDGKLLKSMPPCGQIIGAEGQHFIVRNDDTLTSYDKEGKSIENRKLTAEEMKALNEAGN